MEGKKTSNVPKKRINIYSNSSKNNNINLLFFINININIINRVEKC